MARRREKYDQARALHATGASVAQIARLEAWLAAAEASAIDEVKRFAAKLRSDLAAVQAGLTLRHSNGHTEGHVTKLKLVKRQGYGRARVDLLRQRLLRAV